MIDEETSRRNRLIERVAPTEASIFISQGNSADRSSAARRIHDLSKRSRKPFISIDCAALSGMNLESEIFGHERGSFAGAHTRKIGLIEVSGGGTLYFENVSELDPGNQAKLLRFLNEGDFFRIGGSDSIETNVRVITGSVTDLEELVMKNRFREDLFYRINTVTIRFPQDEVAEGHVLTHLQFDPSISIHELEKRYIIKSLKHFDGNKTQAANSLGITIKTLYNKLHEYGLFEDYSINNVRNLK